MPRRLLEQRPPPCEQVVGSFVHHVPTDEDDATSDDAQATRERTLTAITAAGHAIDEELWLDMAGYTQCHAGCTESPNSGKQ
ncbi:hypothetical protein ACIP4T_31985 [Streptomyces massasporeus]|uniref:hypothetical protein n=1 Tax=Streptomyces massasporeus TaxID=67324 RepID=UPI003674C5A7